MKTQAKISYMGTQVWPRTKKGTFTSLKSRIKYAFRWFMIRTGIAVAATGLLFIGYFYANITAPDLVAINTTQMAAPVAVKDIAPILKKICMAESNCTQFRKDGLPVMHANTNGSVDLGKYQINSAAWGTKAKELGYDLLTEKGNEAMATWILENRGTEDWYSSKVSWKKII